MAENASRGASGLSSSIGSVCGVGKIEDEFDVDFLYRPIVI
jgi:hypothetical protein